MALQEPDRPQLYQDLRLHFPFYEGKDLEFLHLEMLARRGQSPAKQASGTSDIPGRTHLDQPAVDFLMFVVATIIPGPFRRYLAPDEHQEILFHLRMIKQQQ